MPISAWCSSRLKAVRGTSSDTGRMDTVDRLDVWLPASHLLVGGPVALLHVAQDLLPQQVDEPGDHLGVPPLDGVQRSFRELGELRVPDGVDRGGPVHVGQGLHLDNHTDGAAGLHRHPVQGEVDLPDEGRHPLHHRVSHVQHQARLLAHHPDKPETEVGLGYGEEGAVSVSSHSEDKGLPREDGQVTHHLPLVGDEQQRVLLAVDHPLVDVERPGDHKLNAHVLEEGRGGDMR
ncbi:hypothetical protein EYF80_045318 [Liparis tanakae]|uniref:Uncharacterized protein n=1 Tax=Liparis tanakae TaxID=230148 RepID=A0A4Z2FTE4_9TELE|nr:hypothetical protein EYF80_045318 [Liparis tanakae]